MDRTDLTRKEIKIQLDEALRDIRALEKKIGVAQPKVDKADADLLVAKKEAERKVTEEHTSRIGKTKQELADAKQKLTLLRKRFTELSADMLVARDDVKPRSVKYPTVKGTPVEDLNKTVAQPT